MTLDYATLGFKCGLEIHQRLDTRKLFGPEYANPTKTETPLDPAHAVKLERRLRAVVGETGMVDTSASFEAQRGKLITYYAPDVTSGTVATDDEPPVQISQDALNTALTIALLLGSRPVDELHVMRKTIVDGSSPSGFQRTCLLALGGKIDAPTASGGPGIPVAITAVMLEEESAGIVDELDGKAVHNPTFRLDRLGIPLVEIATDATIRTGVHAQAVALAIGKLLRSTGRVQRGLGTIRQDLNVSIAAGARTEIKGAQTLEDLPALIDNEVRRQVGLVHVKQELLARKTKKLTAQPGTPGHALVDLTEILTENAPKFAHGAISKGEKFYALGVPGFAGLLGLELMPNHRLGTELKDYLKAATGINGILHSDEPLNKYGWTDAQVHQARKLAGVDTTDSPKDALIVILCKPDAASRAHAALLTRLNQCVDGVPGETRRANGALSHFMRPLSGASRLYPETDHPPVALSDAFVQRVRAQLPPSSESRRAAYENLGLNSQIAGRLVESDDFSRFDAIRARLPHASDPAILTLVATTLLETLVSLRRDGVQIDSLSDDALVDALNLAATGRVTKAALPDLLKLMSKPQGTGARSDAHSVADANGLSRWNAVRVKKAVAELAKKGVPKEKMMGQLLAQHRLTIDAQDAKQAVQDT